MSVGTYALTSLAALTEYMGITVGDHDVLLENTIDRVTALFEDATRRKLLARDYSYDSDSDAYDAENAILDGNGRDAILLPQYPIQSVTTLRVNEYEIDARDSLTGCGYVIRKDRGEIVLACYLFTKGLQNIELEHNSGFSSVPADLEDAALKQCAWAFKQSPAGSNLLGVAAKNLADGSVSYTQKELLPEVRTTLERYKKRFAL